MLLLQGLFRICKKMFAALPLAAVVSGNTLIVHGGEASHTTCKGSRLLEP